MGVETNSVLRKRKMGPPGSKKKSLLSSSGRINNSEIYSVKNSSRGIAISDVSQKGRGGEGIKLNIRTIEIGYSFGGNSS